MALTELEYHVLAYLANSPTGEGHGWAIRRWLEEKVGLRPPFTTIYRVLERLEERGWLEHRAGSAEESLAGGSRRYYRLSARGLEGLSEGTREMRATVDRLMRSVEAVERGRRTEGAGGT